MSQKDQEAAIDERIERIRKKNEEIQRRYLEVEADKLNAEKLNAAVKFTPSDIKNTERKSFSRPETSNRNPKCERKVPEKPYVPKQQLQGKKFSNFTDDAVVIDENVLEVGQMISLLATFTGSPRHLHEHVKDSGDGPPPDPVYTFLSDHSRDQPRGSFSPDPKATKENTSENEFRGQRGRGRGRGWTRGRGSPGQGSRRGGNNSQFPRQGPQMQPEYQAWRAEREKIDHDRITRQKTAEGNWRREWDSEKISQEENREYQTRPAFTKRKKRDSEEMKIQRTVVNELAISPSPKDNEPKDSERAVKSDNHDRVMLGERKTVAFSVSEGASCNEVIDDDLEEHLEFEHRNIISCGDSIRISLSNKPIKSVRVNPINAAGTGRVGPRQKPRLSYSSQSEDEKEVHPPIFPKRKPTVNVRELPSVRMEVSMKPPLPPIRGSAHELGSPKKKQTTAKLHPFVNKETEGLVVEKKELSRESSHENVSEGGDDSWEDVATSGNESADYSDVDVTKKPDSSNTDGFKGQNVDRGMEDISETRVVNAEEVGGLCENATINADQEFHGEPVEDFYELGKKEAPEPEEEEESNAVSKGICETSDVVEEEGNEPSAESVADELPCAEALPKISVWNKTESLEDGDDITVTKEECRNNKEAISNVCVEITEEDRKSIREEPEISVQEESGVILKDSCTNVIVPELTEVTSHENKGRQLLSGISVQNPELLQRGSEVDVLNVSKEEGNSQVSISKTADEVDKNEVSRISSESKDESGGTSENSDTSCSHMKDSNQEEDHK